jgi:hypothetical protein
MAVRLGGEVITLGVLVLAAACGGSTAEVGNAAPRPAETLVAQARAHERGAGVARDYHAAAELYRQACDDGRGLSSACGALIRAQLRGRGVDLDRGAALALSSKVCLTRRDPFSCVAADLLSGRESEIREPLHGVIMEVVADLEPCNIAHLSECHAQQLASALDFSDSSAAEHRRRRFAMVLCRLDIIEGCVDILDHARRHHDDPDVAVATGRLQAACDRGDADACFEAPERQPIARRALCDASDYEACAALGCDGDAAASKRATDHGMAEDGCGQAKRESRAERTRARASSTTAMAGFRDQMCRCADKPCADRVAAEMTKWGVEMARDSGNQDEPGEAELKAMASITDDLTKCMTKLMTQGTP